MFARCAVQVRCWKSHTPSNGHCGCHRRKCGGFYCSQLQLYDGKISWNQCRDCDRFLTALSAVFSFCFVFLSQTAAWFLFSSYSSSLLRAVVTLQYVLESFVVCVEVARHPWHTNQISACLLVLCGPPSSQCPLNRKLNLCQIVKKNKKKTEFQPIFFCTLKKNEIICLVGLFFVLPLSSQKFLFF